MFFDIFITFFLVFLNGFFVAAEFSIVKVRASQLELKSQKGHKAAQLATHIVSHLDSYLAATQLGITFASLGLGWIGEPVVAYVIAQCMDLVGIEISAELSHTIALPIAFLVITTLHIVFGELAPKSIAIRRSESTALAVAYPLQIFYIVFKPFIWALNGFANIMLHALGISPVHGSEIHSSDELKYLLDKGKESGLNEQMDYDLIKKAFDFSEKTAKQVMIPKTQVFAIDANQFSESKIDMLIEEGYSRIPCYSGAFDNIIGVIYLKDLLTLMKKKLPIDIREVMRTVSIVPETKLIRQILRNFQVKHQHIAVVTNEYGEVSGIITMEDILEELVGEIQDEYDTEAKIIEKIDENTVSVVATAPIDTINELLPHPIEKDEQYQTLAGYLLLKFGRIPNTNEKIKVGNYEFTILKKRRNSIVLVRIRNLLIS